MKLSWMKWVRAFLLLGMFSANSVAAENGAILSRTTIDLKTSSFPESFSPDRVARSLAELREIGSDVTVESIVYESDGLKVKGYLATPRAPGRYPCVIFNRGGNREFGAITPTRAGRLLGNLARSGYVVVASQYRGVDGGEGIEEFGGAEVADVLNLFPLLESIPRADTSRVGMFGWSRGGMMTYLALARTDRVKAAVIGAAPTDMAEVIRDRPEMEERVLAELVPNWATNRSEAIRSRSPLLWPEKLHPETPLLLLHGSADWRVDPRQTLKMAQALYENKRPFRLIFYEGGDHGLSEFREEVDQAVVEWLNHYVRDGKPWPSLEPHGR